MTTPKNNGEGSTTPFQSARPGIERTLRSTMLAVRAVHVLQGLTCVVAARSAYRRPRLAAAAALAALTELVWIARREALDTTTVRVDAAFGAVGLFALSAATYPSDRTSSVNWMLPLTVGSCLGVAAGVKPVEGASITAGFAISYATITRPSTKIDPGKSASSIANTLSYPGFYLVSAVVVRVACHVAAELDDARHKAVEQSARAAAEAARNREHRRLHDSAIQTLEAIASFDLDPETVRRHAGREAAVLRQAIAGDEVHVAGLLAGLHGLAAEFEREG